MSTITCNWNFVTRLISSIGVGYLVLDLKKSLYARVFSYLYARKSGYCTPGKPMTVIALAYFFCFRVQKLCFDFSLLLSLNIDVSFMNFNGAESKKSYPQTSIQLSEENE